MPNITGATQFFPKAAENSVTLALGASVAANATVVQVTNINTNYSNGDTVVLTIDPGLPAVKQVFTGQVSTGTVIGVIWTEGTNQPHTVGAVIIDYTSATHQNLMQKGLSVQHNQDGTHGPISATSITNSGNETITGNLSVGGSLTVAGGGLMPAGVLLPFAGSTSPTGFLLADGSAISRTGYPALFTAIGTGFGIGDGTTTFNIPDTRGKILVSLHTTETEFAALAQTGGEKTHILSGAEMPAHAHGVNDPGHLHGVSAAPLVNAGGGGSDWTNNGTNRGSNNLNWSIGRTTDGAGTGISIQSAGSSSAHNNLQPYLTVNHIIKT